jgi:ADP-ribose pyrophosphatase
VSGIVVTPIPKALNVVDDDVPLDLNNERTVFREHGGADFTVTVVDATVSQTGKKMTLHFASVKDNRPGAVCVAVIKSLTVSDKKLYLVARHWRASIGRWEWEFPRGMGEPGETIEETSLRELEEETGICAGIEQVKVLQSMHADTGMLRDNVAVTAIEFSNDEQRNYALNPKSHLDWELSHMQCVSESDLKKCIAQGHIVDGLTLSSFFLYLLYTGE